MVDTNLERRLAAVVAIDVVGYSRLMGKDEEGTIAALKAHRRAIDPIGLQYGGRIVGTAGDSILFEFPSVVDAVNCAIQIQSAMDERNAEFADQHKMLFRIGINLGDVFVDADGDIFGDGVNVAARIEALAEPGGICISRTVRDNIRDRMELTFEDLGEFEVKNISRPLRVFRVLGQDEVATTPQRSRNSLPMIGALIALVAVAVGGLFLWFQQPDFEPADLNKYAYELPEKPSIAVLPFDNLTGDSARDYLGDGLTENIIAVFSTSPYLFVIARNSSFSYKGKATSVQKIAEELGVRYVLEGSVQASGNSLRVTAQLVDALNGKHLWAERYDRQLEDFLAIQDDITNKISSAMHVQLVLGNSAHEALQQLDDIENQRLFLTGLQQSQLFTPDAHKKSEELFLELIRRLPNSAKANEMMGYVHWQKIAMGISHDRKADMTAARRYSAKALSIAKTADSYLLSAILDLVSRQHDSAVSKIDNATKLAPGDAGVHYLGGWVKASSGYPKQGVHLMKLGIRMQPYFPDFVYHNMVAALIELKDYAEAKKIGESLLAKPKIGSRFRLAGQIRLAAISALEGDLPNARKYVELALDIQPDYSAAKFKRNWAYKKNQKFVAEITDALIRAGLPE